MAKETKEEGNVARGTDGAMASAPFIFYLPQNLNGDGVMSCSCFSRRNVQVNKPVHANQFYKKKDAMAAILESARVKGVINRSTATNKERIMEAVGVLLKQEKGKNLELLGNILDVGANRLGGVGEKKIIIRDMLVENANGILNEETHAAKMRLKVLRHEPEKPDSEKRRLPLAFQRRQWLKHNEEIKRSPRE